TTDMYPLSLHDALPILKFPELNNAFIRVFLLCPKAARTMLKKTSLTSGPTGGLSLSFSFTTEEYTSGRGMKDPGETFITLSGSRSEEHTSELQSRENVV